MENRILKGYVDTLKAKYRMNNKVMFIQCPQFDLSLFSPEIALKKGYYAFPPAGLQYLYESLRNREVEFKILDLNFLILKSIHEDKSFDYKDWMSIVRKSTESFDPYIVGVSCLFDMSIKSMLEILKYLREIDRSVIVAGGIIASYEQKDLLSRELCHFVIEGEGEQKLNYLFDFLTDENTLVKSQPGIHFKDGGKYYESTGESVPVKMEGDLIKSYSLVKVEDYYRYGSLNPFSRIAGIDSTPFASIQTSRGCRGSCTFCSVRSFMGTGVRSRNPEDILREVNFLVRERGIKHFELLDDDPLFHRDNFMKVLKGIIDEKLDITWSANNGLMVSSIDEELLGLMRDSGCIGFKIGIETGNPEMLKKIRKPVTFEKIRELCGKLHKYQEIFVGGNFIVGFPEEKFAQMLDTFTFAMELDLDWAAFTICQAIRGAEAFAESGEYFEVQMKHNGQLLKNFIPSRGGSALLEAEDVLTGLDIFDIPMESVPAEPQIKEIWYTFNLIRNYIYNKNLTPRGRIEKFISWVEMALVAYPNNPYMNLFLALGYLIKDERAKAQKYRKRAAESNVMDCWERRLDSFGLPSVIEDFPYNREEAFKKIEEIKYAVSQRIPKGH